MLDEKTIKIKVTVEDAVAMIEEASHNVEKYAREMITIRDKMPEFAYTHFCFYRSRERWMCAFFRDQGGGYKTLRWN